MEYDFRRIEKDWQEAWEKGLKYKVDEIEDKPKFYVLDMFPYPSGAGLHVGHPLGYIASDIVARYKRHKGYNVLHPMGFDSFGLPAEQYAIQTGQHPAVTTEANTDRYRDQMQKIGFSFDWNREVMTSDPSYYKWTQWIFGRLFESWFDLDQNKARPINELINAFEQNGYFSVNPSCDDNWWEDLDMDLFPHFEEHFSGSFTATDWNSFNEEQKNALLMQFRLTYLADSEVNWCPELGTVLANDEVKDGLSERGGHPVERKKMRQWMMRITAYAERLLSGLDDLNWTDSIKEAQRNWVGRSEGAVIRFKTNRGGNIEVFTTRPDTIYGVSFMVLAPEHDLVGDLTSEENREEVEAYIEAAKKKSERERQGEKEVTGVALGGSVVHPFTGEEVPVYIAEYVLAGYGTGAIMAVPAGDERDWKFAKKFGIEVPAIFKGVDTDEEVCTDEKAKLVGSGELNGLKKKEAIPAAIEILEKSGHGEKRINYRLRNAVFSRQRYWGEPFPICYEGDIPQLIEDELITLPSVDAYLPTKDGEPPLARAAKEDWPVFKGDRMETNTMPGWAGSSWYFLRYMDPHNESAFCDRSKSDYWGQVDLYVGGAEHTTGHLLYSRFWTKFLCDLGFIGFDEPFKTMINQGMILGRSSFVYRVQGTSKFVSYEKRKEYSTQRLHVDINLVENDKLDLDGFKASREEYSNAEFILGDDGTYTCGHEVEKMSKSKYNVQTPDELVEKYGADTLRCYEMFLGPLTQSKPWDTQGINGVHNFLRKIARLVEGSETKVASSDELRIVHKAIEKVSSDLERYAFNTVVSAMMIAVNDLIGLKKSCSKEALKDLIVLLSPYAPHLAEELWKEVGGKGFVIEAVWPDVNSQYLVAEDVTYPVSFNGKVRFKLTLPADMPADEVEKVARENENTLKQMDGREIRKVIVVPGRIINIVG
ncbi:MAG: leucine--tRNA ligase [Crocinitomicaceae bacterium]|nr:leucine--tRNA ligase [Crocinitomicaceae bacterium]